MHNLVIVVLICAAVVAGGSRTEFSAPPTPDLMRWLGLDITDAPLAKYQNPVDPALLAPPINTAPGLEYADSARIFQGIPALERAHNGRLWAAWYAGRHDEPGEGPGNYVVLVTSGDDAKTWSEPKVLIDPLGDVRAYDETLWLDPQGRLWLFWAQSYQWWDGRSGVWCIVTENPGDPTPHWSVPRRLCDGIMMNKPTVLKNGDWLLPVSVWDFPADKRTPEMYRHDLEDGIGAKVIISRDRGMTFSVLGKTRSPAPNADEHMIVERRDGSLWMLIRTNAGIAESMSTDAGKTWTPAQPSSIPHLVSRFFIRRLNSGRLLLVKHVPPPDKANIRMNLTAFLSDDDGRTWKGGLMLDDRAGVSYPDGVQDKNGMIRIIYDYMRDKDKMILMAEFSEKDVLAGKPSNTTRLRILVNQASGNRLIKQ